MVDGEVRLGLRPELVVVLAFDDLAAHAGNSLGSVGALHEGILPLGVQPDLRAGLQHQIQGRLRRTPDRAEATGEHHVTQAGLAGLSAQRRAAGLRE